MNIDTEKITKLEWANYAATLPTAEVTPDLEVILREDIIITSSMTFPAPDVNHACLMRATPETADGLIDEVIAYFQGKELPPTVFVSPACMPADLGERLVKRGFVKQEEQEAWMAMDLKSVKLPSPSSKIQVRQIAQEEALTFTEVFMSSFEMPTDLALAMAQLLKPSINLPGVHHYIAFSEEQPVGTCSLIQYQEIGILGSAGVLPKYRRSGAATNLTIKAITESQQHGIDTLILQTAAGTLLERLLRISNFRKVFTRISYTLP